ncbi:MAG: ribonuclease P protein component [Thiotrichales bacterium]
MPVVPKVARVSPHNQAHPEAEDASGAKFPRTLRLLDAGAFRRVFNEPPYVSRSRPWVILSAPGTTPHARLGIVAAKRKVRKAVDRNRLKRLVRESFRVTSTQLPAYDIVVLLQVASNSMTNAEFSQRLQREWVKLSRAVSAASPTPSDF